MPEFEREVGSWRAEVERRSSLAPRELDELEDHLRALVDLEMELDASLARPQAFAIARHALGEPRALSREFARAGRPRWKLLLAGASALYAASLLLPVYDMSQFWGLGPWRPRGYELLADVELLPLNLPMLLILPLIWRRRRLKGTWLAAILGAIAVPALALGVVGAVSTGGVTLLLGYWAWSASFALGSIALWLRRRGWASARPPKGLATGS